MKTRLFLILIIIYLSGNAVAQFSVSGKITDISSHEPLPGASVFFQNTTIGTAANSRGEFTLPLPPGGYDLVVTSSGYQSKIIRITGTDTTWFEIEMAKVEKNMEEVIIRSSNEIPDGWEKYGQFFIEHFIGTTPFSGQCRLENPEALKFYLYKRSNKLKVLSEEPLQINNRALGYHLRYQLDSFVYYYGTEIDTYRGFCMYSEMEGTEEEKKSWSKNRLNAYMGSKLHFMRSYYDSTLAEDGFTVDMLDEQDDTQFRAVSNPYDSLYYYPAADSTFEIEIYYPRKFRVIYTKKRPEAEYVIKMGLPKKVATQISYLELADVIALRENGYYYDQKNLVVQGYWSWKNLSDQLPYDFYPY